MAERNYWASRIDAVQSGYFWTELKAGRLRQGWGYAASQDLRLVTQKPWDNQSREERETYRQRHMLGKEHGWQDGDIILIPNLPSWGMFALAEVSGPYGFEIDHQLGDYGHFRKVKLLTTEGVSKNSSLVDSSIRSTLRNAGRTWSINHLGGAIETVIAHATDKELLKDSTELQRAELTLHKAMSAAAEELHRQFAGGLRKMLRAAEWEKVIATAARMHFPTAAVRQTGGPREQGADIEIEVPNPFGGAPWITVVQVKDYEGEMGSHVVHQLRDAIVSRRHTSEDGIIGRHVVAAVLASTSARPSAELQEAIIALERELGVPVTVIHGRELMELILRGASQYGALQSN